MGYPARVSSTQVSVLPTSKITRKRIVTPHLTQGILCQDEPLSEVDLSVDKVFSATNSVSFIILSFLESPYYSKTFTLGVNQECVQEMGSAEGQSPFAGGLGIPPSFKSPPRMGDLGG
jgi:hypothetical protein